MAVGWRRLKKTKDTNAVGPGPIVRSLGTRSRAMQYTPEPEEMRLRCAKPPPGPIFDRELWPSLVDLIYLLFAKKYDVVVITSYGD